MNSGRLLGIVLSVMGFTIAVAAGLYLAVRLSRSELDVTGVLVGAGLAFIPVALLAGAGLYIYAQNARREEPEPESTMRQQRDLVDWLRSQGHISLDDAAQRLNVEVDAVRAIVRELIGLRVFSGYVDWQSGVLYQVETERLRAMHDCQTCGSPIDVPENGVVGCKGCQTEYFSV